MSDEKMSVAHEWLEAQVDRMIELQRELTARPAVGPDSGGPGEHAKGEFLSEYCRSHGLPVLDRWDAADPRADGRVRPNFAVGLTEETRATSKIWVMSHLDVVPPGEPDGEGGWKGWQGDPWTLRVENGKVYGRGVEDDQGGIVPSIFALLALREVGHAPPLPVRLLFVSDEETGSRFGLDHILTVDRSAFSEEDLIVVPDAGNEDGTMVEVAEKSLLWLRFTVTGKQCHASMPQLGVNACRVAAHLTVRLDELNRLYSGVDTLFDPPRSTFEPTLRPANVPNVNTAPGRDVFCFDCRILPAVDVDDVLEWVGRTCSDVESEHGVHVDVEIIQRQNAAEATPEDAPVVTALRSAVRDVLGVEAQPKGIGGGTVAAHFRRAGFPAAVWLKCGHSAHQPDEFCRIDFMLDNAKVFARLFAGQLNG